MLIISFVVYVAYKLYTTEEHLYYTESIDDYNTEKYPVNSCIFAEEIPEYAEVIAFSYYDYWNEAIDIYLELKFDSEEDLNSYLESVRTRCLSCLDDYRPPTNTGWIVEEENPYNTRFTDWLCTLFSISVNDEHYTGYEISPGETETKSDCNFGIISYSYEDLTVIQARTCGNFRSTIHKYTPKYFARFGVPQTEPHERTVNLEWQGK